MGKTVVYLDTETSTQDNRILDIGAIRDDGSTFHSPSLRRMAAFIGDAEYICGHNLIHFDLPIIRESGYLRRDLNAIDTLWLSPLLFPQRQSHKLPKDEQLSAGELNNPVNDSLKARDLFYDELNAFASLSPNRQHIYWQLLNDKDEFAGFFSYIGMRPDPVDIAVLIHEEYAGIINADVNLDKLSMDQPVALAYALALAGDGVSSLAIPHWLRKNFPQTDTLLRQLQGRTMPDADPPDIHTALKSLFGYDEFRTFGNEPLQERAVQAAMDGKSLLAVFPTGGGKSLTFQLPALIAGRTKGELTVVISPLQSLMKDQVDKLNSMGIEDAVTINGLLDPIERANAIERVANGWANLLYISPEQLRSYTIERILRSRRIGRFVIDEAHCFSAWGQDFRVDYLYIGDFIHNLCKQRVGGPCIPVSCFTATARRQVIEDIQKYFKSKLDIELETFMSSAQRVNLHYKVSLVKSDEEKYGKLRELLAQTVCPTIIYAARVKTTRELAGRLSHDGFPALPFNGQMNANEKIKNQELFIKNKVRIVVATSAFGMGVDKSDVGLVIHYEIPDSIENYLQEAGRAGRDASLQADCVILFKHDDLNIHFNLLNRSRVKLQDINQIWSAIKSIAGQRADICCSALDLARIAGWIYPENAADSGITETRVKTAVNALETAGYIRRENNMPQVYASSIQVRNMVEASERIDCSPLFAQKLKEASKRIIKHLISCHSLADAGNCIAQSRIDYIADTLGLNICEVIQCVNLMRQEGILSDANDMTARIMIAGADKGSNDTRRKSNFALNRFIRQERFLLGCLSEDELDVSLKELNEKAHQQGISSGSDKDLRTLLRFYAVKGYLKKQEDALSQRIHLTRQLPVDELATKLEMRSDLCSFIISELFSKAVKLPPMQNGEVRIQFSLLGLMNAHNAGNPKAGSVSQNDVEDALLYLSRIGALRLEGGFLVIYNRMQITRLVFDNSKRYTKDDYKQLNDFYDQKTQKIHIVGEFALLLLLDIRRAMQLIWDYFQYSAKQFINKYFKGRSEEIRRSITADKYDLLFSKLSKTQRKIIDDNGSSMIVVAAGPGSGKTLLLVHKLASLLLLEDIKHEQLLMLTFSRAAAAEFKKRLALLIGKGANFVQIKTFHSYCFDLLGRIGNLDEAKNVVKEAVARIGANEIEESKITRSVLVIDEAQDMDADEFALVRALIRHNENNMRVIAVGDDDQNIFAFRGSDSKYMRALIDENGATKYEMSDNYRSRSRIVELSNAFVSSIHDRLKDTPIRPAVGKGGVVSIVHHISGNVAEAVGRDVLAARGQGTACVLTRTNDEASIMTGLLLRKGIRAKLIQSNDGFRLCDLAEVRYFLEVIDAALVNRPKISDELWERAKAELSEQYAGSRCLALIRNLIANFEEVCPEKYRSDLQDFIFESNIEDFARGDSESVLVSTIHKAKGREFDRVYLLLNMKPNADINDEDRRALYVAMTRAKEELHIHCNTDLFRPFITSGIQYTQDTASYPEPEEIARQLTHKDVYLGFFKGREALITGLRSGDKLSIKGKYLFASIHGRVQCVASLSKKCCEELERQAKLGYHPSSANVRFIVWWKCRDDGKDYPILLPNIHLRKGLQLMARS